MPLNMSSTTLLMQNINRFFYTQRQIHTAVFGGKSSVKGSASGTASSIAFTPLQVSICTKHSSTIFNVRMPEDFKVVADFALIFCWGFMLCCKLKNETISYYRISSTT